MTEANIVRSLVKFFPVRSRNVIVGIGDDTAVLQWKKDEQLLFTTDAVVENVHFVLKKSSPALIGRKALAVNISDIAAMGGIPRYAVVSVGLPATASSRINGIAQGIADLAEEFDVTVVGGNLSRCERLFVDIALIGSIRGKKPVLRKGARPGDVVFVTGSLGGSSAGKHFTFTPRVKEAQTILRAVPISSMMDISDGLSTDLPRLLAASKAGAVISAESIPISTAAKTMSKSPAEALHHALSDGEDYELLFTVPAARAGRVPRRIGNVPVTRIGTVTYSRGCHLLSQGKKRPLRNAGFDHFTAKKPVINNH